MKNKIFKVITQYIELLTGNNDLEVRDFGIFNTNLTIKEICMGSLIMDTIYQSNIEEIKQAIKLLENKIKEILNNNDNNKYNDDYLIFNDLLDFSRFIKKNIKIKIVYNYFTKWKFHKYLVFIIILICLKKHHINIVVFLLSSK